MRVLTYTVFIGFGTHITGTFAMNIPDIETYAINNFPFVVTTVGTAALALFGGMGFMYYLKVKGLLPIEATYHERAKQEDDVNAIPTVYDTRADSDVNIQVGP